MMPCSLVEVLLYF